MNEQGVCYQNYINMLTSPIVFAITYFSYGLYAKLPTCLLFCENRFYENQFYKSVAAVLITVVSLHQHRIQFETSGANLCVPGTFYTSDRCLLFQQSTYHRA